MAEIDELDSENYEENSYNDFLDVLDAQLEIYSDHSATQFEIDTTAVKLEAALSAGSLESVLKSAYNTLNSAILDLEISARVELKEALVEKKLLCPAELDNLDVYYEAISDGEAIYDDLTADEDTITAYVKKINETKADLSGNFTDTEIWKQTLIPLLQISHIKKLLIVYKLIHMHAVLKKIFAIRAEKSSILQNFIFL